MRALRTLAILALAGCSTLHPRPKNAPRPCGPCEVCEPDDAKAKRLASCQHGDLNACNAASDDERIAQREAAAFLLAERACAGGIGSACTSAGMLLFEGRAAHVDHIERMLREGCRLDDGTACANLFVLSRMAPPVLQLTEDEVHALVVKGQRLLRAECQRGVKDSCDTFVDYFAPDDDNAEIASFERIGCSKQSWQLCGRRLRRLDLDEASVKQAATMIGCFCDHGVKDACTTLAEQLSQQMTKPRLDAIYASGALDHAAGHALIEELGPACADDPPQAIACYALSLAFRRGAGAAVDVVAADRALAIACRLQPALCSTTSTK